ncbi:hypothetical protein [Paenibacillus sinopodophylli]|uniref:hypothetical protein n=1 Tax=Paenibacillus sinopodophylli TaxID=1837342 RepID=UPI00110CA690|nr:hypothetical protein [Paenibacillus sinopodophylli]
MSKYKKTVKVTDPNHNLFGQELAGARVYFDIHHTGNSPDLYLIVTPNGEQRILSTQIDEKHYDDQGREEGLKRLGAKVGDVVMITRSGSGSSNAGFSTNVPHTITAICKYGDDVTFDNGEARMFRPDVVQV